MDVTVQWRGIPVGKHLFQSSSPGLAHPSFTSLVRTRILLQSVLKAESSSELWVARSPAQSCAGNAELAAAAARNFFLFFLIFVCFPPLCWRWPNFERASAGQVVRDILLGYVIIITVFRHASSCFLCLFCCGLYFCLLMLVFFFSSYVT